MLPMRWRQEISTALLFLHHAEHNPSFYWLQYGNDKNYENFQFRCKVISFCPGADLFWFLLMTAKRSEDS